MVSLLISVGLLLGASSSASAAVDDLPDWGSITLTSEQGSWVGVNGTSTLFDPANSELSSDAAGYPKPYNDRALLRLTNTPLGSASLEFSSELSYLPDISRVYGSDLRPGLYSGATRYPFNLEVPGMDVSAGGHGCNESNGWFDVRDVGFDDTGDLEKLWLLYRQVCDDDDGAGVFGEVRIGLPAPADGIAVTPSAARWPDTQVGSSSAAETVTVTNNGGQPVTVSTLGVTGLNASDFTLANDGCTGTTVQPGDDCEAQVRFQPTAAGPRMGQAVLQITGGASHPIELDGRALPAPGGDTTPPGRVHGVTVVRDGTSADVSWVNPTDADFSHAVVRWLPGTGKPPIPESGNQGYAGTGTSVELHGLDSSRPLSLSVFAVDNAGNSSVPVVSGPPDPVTPSGPATPRNDNSPMITGNAEPDSSVSLFSTPDCSGSPISSGSAAAFATLGLPASVPDDSSTTFRTTVTNAEGTSACSQRGFVYREDSTAPPLPIVNQILPASGSNNNSPHIRGQAEDNSTVSIYTHAGCDGAPVKGGTDIQFLDTGISVPVPDDSKTEFYVTATDVAGNESGCAGPFEYIEESFPPAAPSSMSFVPGSPANDNAPRLRGVTSGAAQVRVFSGADCSGTPLLSADPSEFASPGVQLSVGDNTASTFSAQAVDIVGHEVCSAAPATYVEDSIPPPAPALTQLSPGPVGATTHPTARGVAEPGSQVTLYGQAGCSGPSVGSASAANFAAGVPLQVSPNVANQISATARDVAGNESPCSSSLAYLADTNPPETAVKRKGKARRARRIVVLLASSEAGSTFRCSRDRRPFAPCAARVVMSLRPGKHSFRAFAVDAVGNTDATPSTLKLLVRR